MYNKKTKKTKKIRIKHKKINKKSIKGGTIEYIDLRQILLSQPIIDIIKLYNPNIDLKQYKLSKKPHGFRLSRMTEIMNADFDKLLEIEPIEIIEAKNEQGKFIVTKINGNIKKLYEINNGRHRVARAIIEGIPNIKSKIL